MTDEFDEEIDSVLEEDGMRRSRRTVLDEIQVTGTPEGTGSVTMGEGGRVEYGDYVDPSLPTKRAPTGPTREQIARWEVETGRSMEGEEISPLWDTLETVSPLTRRSRADQTGARSAERLHRFWDQLTLGDAELGGRNPIRPIVGRDRRAEAPIAGYADGLSLGWADEIGAGIRAPIRGESYDDALSEIRGRDRAAREQAPELYSVGEAGGIATGALALPSIPVAQGAGTAARVGAAAGTGAIYGGLSGAGHSDADTIGGRVEDAIEPAIAGGFTGGVLGVGAEGVRRLADPASRAAVREYADESLLAATRPHGSRSEAVGAFLSDAADTSADAYSREVADAAGTLRSARTPEGQRIVPRVGSMSPLSSTTDVIADRATRARRAGAPHAVDEVLEAAQHNAQHGGHAPGHTMTERLIARFGRTAQATGLDWLARLMDVAPSSPRVAGYAERLSEAAGRGPAALTATHYTLMQRDAEYRRLAEEAQEAAQSEEAQGTSGGFDAELDALLSE